MSGEIDRRQAIGEIGITLAGVFGIDQSAEITPFTIETNSRPSKEDRTMMRITSEQLPPPSSTENKSQLIIVTDCTDYGGKDRICKVSKFGPREVPLSNTQQVSTEPLIPETEIFTEGV